MRNKHRWEKRNRRRSEYSWGLRPMSHPMHSSGKAGLRRRPSTAGAIEAAMPCTAFVICTRIVLYPLAFRSSRYVGKSAAGSVTLASHAASPWIRNAVPFWSTRYLPFADALSGKRKARRRAGISGSERIFGAVNLAARCESKRQSRRREVGQAGSAPYSCPLRFAAAWASARRTSPVDACV